MSKFWAQCRNNKLRIFFIVNAKKDLQVVTSPIVQFLALGKKNKISCNFLRTHCFSIIIGRDFKPDSKHERCWSRYRNETRQSLCGDWDDRIDRVKFSCQRQSDLPMIKRVSSGVGLGWQGISLKPICTPAGKSL